jgi:uncharacterized protein (TIGR03084 family)
VEELLDALAAQHADLWAMLAAAPEEQFTRPTPCDGWTVADVVTHLSQTDELARASLRGEFTECLGRLTRGTGGAASIDDGAARMVELADARSPVEIRDQWNAGASALRAEFGRSDAHRRVSWVAGELSTFTLAATRLAEAWIHTGDVGSAWGIPPACDGRLQHISRLAWRTLPYAFARAGRELRGPVAFDLIGPDGEHWRFDPAGEPLTIISGRAEDLCAVAGRRVLPSATGLTGSGPDAGAVLELVRTYA